ncbi:hypothetical protein O5169_27845 [Escherichia coli]|nr:hypothetical protein [Escherichia coli]
MTPLPSSAVTVHRGVGQALSPLMSTPAPLPVALPEMTPSVMLPLMFSTVTVAGGDYP